MTIPNDAEINMKMQVCLQDGDFISLGYMTISAIAGSFCSLEIVYDRHTKELHLKPKPTLKAKILYI